MRILHVGDMSGVASITANMCSKLGHPSVVILDDKTDIWNHGKYYNNTADCSSTEVMIKVIKGSLDRYDHIVYHDRYNVAAELDHLQVPSSFIFHGNMLRQEPDIYTHVSNLTSIENIFVSSEDLLKYAPEATVFRRPIDLDLFHIDENKVRSDMAVCLTQARYLEQVRHITADVEHDVIPIDRSIETLEYKEMPILLNSLKFYYDIKFQPTHPPTLLGLTNDMVVPELSMTGLQALACGVQVWSNGIWFYKFPMEYSDENACKEFISVLEA